MTPIPHPPSDSRMISWWLWAPTSTSKVQLQMGDNGKKMDTIGWAPTKYQASRHRNSVSSVLTGWSDSLIVWTRKARLSHWPPGTQKCCRCLCLPQSWHLLYHFGICYYHPIPVFSLGMLLMFATSAEWHLDKCSIYLFLSWGRRNLFK